MFSFISLSLTVDCELSICFGTWLDCRFLLAFKMLFGFIFAWSLALVLMMLSLALVLMVLSLCCGLILFDAMICPFEMIWLSSLFLSFFFPWWWWSLKIDLSFPMETNPFPSVAGLIRISFSLIWLSFCILWYSVWKLKCEDEVFCCNFFGAKTGVILVLLSLCNNDILLLNLLYQNALFQDMKVLNKDIIEEELNYFHINKLK